jgi:hypothetical protein
MNANREIGTASVKRAASSCTGAFRVFRDTADLHGYY